MSNPVYYRHFRVDSGPLIDEVNRIIQTNEEAAPQWRELYTELGAVGAEFSDSGNVLCIEFEQEPDRKIWRVCRSGYMPKKNCKAGRALAERFKAMPRYVNVSSALSTIGLHDGLALIDATYGYFTRLAVAGGVCFVRVPWRDVPAAEMAEYIKNELSFNCSMEHLQWTPPAEFVELKEWEFLRDLEQMTGVQEAA